MCQLLAPNTRKLEGSLAGPAPAPEGIFNESRLINLWLVILYSDSPLALFPPTSRISTQPTQLDIFHPAGGWERLGRLEDQKHRRS